MTEIELAVSSLEGRSFNDLSSILKKKVDSWQENSDNVECFADDVEDEGICSSQDYTRLANFKASMNKLNQIAGEVNLLLDELYKKASSSKELKMVAYCFKIFCLYALMVYVLIITISSEVYFK